jgi:hypothetical protein
VLGLPAHQSGFALRSRTDPEFVTLAVRAR